MKRPSKREFTRSATNVRVRITVADPDERAGTVIEGLTQDLSMNGLRMKCATPVPVATRCDLSLVLAGGNADVPVRLKGKVTRAESSAMAVSFTEIEDDSLEHLRKLILYNSAETEKTELELDEHVGLKDREEPKSF